MRRLQIFLCGVALLALVACHEPTSEEVAKATLKAALTALDEGNYDAYLQHVDLGMELDSARKSFMDSLLRQHVGWRRSERAAVVAIDMVDATMQGDSICTVYCQYTFADSTKEVLSQKMVKQGEAWKIRLRN